MVGLRSEVLFLLGVFKKECRGEVDAEVNNVKCLDLTPIFQFFPNFSPIFLVADLGLHCN